MRANVLLPDSVRKQIQEQLRLRGVGQMAHRAVIVVHSTESLISSRLKLKSFLGVDSGAARLGRVQP
jgi:hypothetical protein